MDEVRLRAKKEFAELRTIYVKKEAVKLYFQRVKVEEWRKKFLENIEKYPVVDLRDRGYYCTDCGRFSPTPQMQIYEVEVVHMYKKDSFTREIEKIAIVQPHYDGCRGWD